MKVECLHRHTGVTSSYVQCAVYLTLYQYPFRAGRLKSGGNENKNFVILTCLFTSLYIHVFTIYYSMSLALIQELNFLG